MKLGIVGGGVVGSALARSYLEHVDEVRVYDVLAERRTHSLDDVFACDLVFVCLPTPQNADGSCDTNALNKFFLTALRDCRYVIRSTVPIGYTAKVARAGFNVVHSPEFLTARCAYADACMPARHIIGYPGAVDMETCPLYQLYSRRFPGGNILGMFSDASEAVKLIQNSFFAVKVAFFNEAFSLCNKLGIDYGTVRAGILADGRIASNHTMVPGPDGKRGFGGTCLPKDLASYVHQLHAAGLSAWVAQSALHRNTEDRPHGHEVQPPQARREVQAEGVD